MNKTQEFPDEHTVIQVKQSIHRHHSRKELNQNETQRLSWDLHDGNPYAKKRQAVPQQNITENTKRQPTRAPLGPLDVILEPHSAAMLVLTRRDVKHPGRRFL